MTNRADIGFTLIELLISLAVASILLAAALPSFARLSARTKARAADNAIVGALHYARNRAIHAGGDVLFCPSSDGRRCSNTTRWDGGWLIATDRDHDNQPDGKPLRVRAHLPANVTMISSSGRRHVRYGADGAAPGSNLSIIVCRHGKAHAARSVVVSNSGRIRQGTPTQNQASACASAG